MTQPLATPYGNLLLIRPLKKKKVMVGSLEIDETDLEKAQVVKTKPDSDFNVGDIVYYPEKPAIGHTHEGELLQWLRIDDVHGYLTKEEHEQLEKEDGNTI